ncbi:MAG TPA: DNA-binding protein [Cyanophyceae cyanobacterium]
MKRGKRINFWVNEKEYEQLSAYAESQELSISEALRDYIKSLPKASKNNDRNSPYHQG